MPLYIRNDEVAELARQVQQATNARTLTEAVRLALQHELEREKGKPSLVDIGVAFCRDLRRRSNPQTGQAAEKDFIDSLYGGDT